LKATFAHSRNNLFDSLGFLPDPMLGLIVCQAIQTTRIEVYPHDCLKSNY